MPKSAVPMREPLRSEVIERLCSAMSGKVDGLYIQKLECPDCGQRVMFTSVEGPWRLQCGRHNKCGVSYHVKELFPDLFDTWTERYGRPAVERAQADGKPVDASLAQSATPVADAYLELGRGFDLARVRGWYSQEAYWDDAIQAGTATVRFPLPNGFWERLLDKPQRFGKQKARAVGSFKGLWWAPPGVDLVSKEEIWIVEGIFDALSLLHAGVTAVSTISCNNYPDSALAGLAQACTDAGTDRPRLVWAYDGDKAGAKYSREFAMRSRKDGWPTAAAVIPARRGVKRRDWNDAWQREELGAKDREEYRYHGSLLIARGYREKGDLMYGHSGLRSFWLEFGNRLYWYEMDEAKLQKALEDHGCDEYTEPEPDDLKAITKSAGSCRKIANCAPEALYYMAAPITDEAWYYWAVHFPGDRKSLRNTFTSAQQSSPAEFGKRLMHIAPGAIWEGTAAQLLRLLNDQIDNIKVIDTIDYVGYAKEHDAWLWGDVSVKDGRIYQLNEEDHFAFPRANVKSLSRVPLIEINTDRTDYQTDWAKLIRTAYGPRGLVCLAFWLGALFAEQIRDRYESYPYLELVGEPGSGKTTLLEFLWQLYGRADTEGFCPVTSTLSFRSRTLAQVSNLPVVMIEADREPDASTGHKQTQFNWDEFKPLFNGRGPRGTGMKTVGNETREPPFRGALVISQNAHVNASDAILSRIVQAVFSRDGFSAETERAASALVSMPMEQVSGFALQAATRAKKLLELFGQRLGGYEAEIGALPTIKMNRVARNHAKMAALLDCLGPDGLGLLPLNTVNEAVLEAYAMAEERQQAINADHPIVQEFWEAYDYAQDLGHQKALLNHYGSDRDDLIAINLKHFEAVTAELKLRAPTSAELKRHLKTSKTRPFIDSNRAVCSQLFELRTMRCWVFGASK